MPRNFDTDPSSNPVTVASSRFMTGLAKAMVAKMLPIPRYTRRMAYRLGGLGESKRAKEN